MLQNKFLPTYESTGKYLPTWESLNEHTLPKWFMDAKFGIFIHWGPYSVPAWAPKKTTTGEYYNDQVGNHPYAEIYGYGMMYKDSAVWKHHKATYGAGFQYEDFFPQFRAENWDPGLWAETFRKVGAKYVVLVTKHSDCYSMFDTKLTDRCCTKIGPMRDITGELTAELRKQGLKSGLYYSTTFDWYSRNFPHVIYKEFTHGQIKELVDQYHPDILWSDDYWKPIEKSCSDTWGSKELISYFYNHSEHPEEVLVNDRWGCEKDGRQIGDFSTPEYTALPTIQDFYWETNRGIGRSFGYNQEEGDEDYAAAEDLIFMLADIVSKNGNLLLNVGPRADGTIHPLQLQRLEEIGSWLQVNGEAIYQTRPWIDAAGLTGADGRVRFTQKGSAVYANIFDTKTRDFTIRNLFVPSGTKVELLGSDAPVVWEQQGGDTVFHLPAAQSAVSFVLKFNEEPLRLLRKPGLLVPENRTGEIFRRMGYYSVNL